MSQKLSLLCVSGEYESVRHLLEEAGNTDIVNARDSGFFFNVNIIRGMQLCHLCVMEMLLLTAILKGIIVVGCANFSILIVCQVEI